MMLFLFLTILFLLGFSSLIYMAWISIQPGNWGEGWQRKLREWDMEGKEFLYRTLGGCALCTSHLFAQLSFPVYFSLLITNGVWPLGFFSSVIWYGIYVGIATNLNLLFITKLHQ